MSPPVRLIITGFGSFGDCEENPTSRHVTWLEEEVISRNSSFGSGDDCLIKQLTVLRVAAQVCPA
jgi:hypothetical protein